MRKLIIILCLCVSCKAVSYSGLNKKEADRKARGVQTAILIPHTIFALIVFVGVFEYIIEDPDNIL